MSEIACMSVRYTGYKTPVLCKIPPSLRKENRETYCKDLEESVKGSKSAMYSVALGASERRFTRKLTSAEWSDVI